MTITHPEPGTASVRAAQQRLAGRRHADPRPAQRRPRPAGRRPPVAQGREPSARWLVQAPGSPARRRPAGARGQPRAGGAQHRQPRDRRRARRRRPRSPRRAGAAARRRAGPGRAGAGRRSPGRPGRGWPGRSAPGSLPRSRARQGLDLVDPYEDGDVIAGNGTAVAELLDQMTAAGARPAADRRTGRRWRRPGRRVPRGPRPRPGALGRPWLRGRRDRPGRGRARGGRLAATGVVGRAPGDRAGSSDHRRRPAPAPGRRPALPHLSRGRGPGPGRDRGRDRRRARGHAGSMWSSWSSRLPPRPLRSPSAWPGTTRAFMAPTSASSCRAGTSSDDSHNRAGPAACPRHRPDRRRGLRRADGRRPGGVALRSASRRCRWELRAAPVRCCRSPHGGRVVAAQGFPAAHHRGLPASKRAAETSRGRPARAARPPPDRRRRRPDAVPRQRGGARSRHGRQRQPRGQRGPPLHRVARDQWTGPRAARPARSRPDLGRPGQLPDRVVALVLRRAALGALPRPRGTRYGPITATVPGQRRWRTRR